MGVPNSATILSDVQPSHPASGWCVFRRPQRAFRPGERTTLTYRLSVGREGIAPGGRVAVSFYPGPWGSTDAALYATRLQAEDPDQPNPIALAPGPGRFAVLGCRRGWWLFENRGGRLPAGVSLEVVVGDAAPGRVGRLRLPKHPRYEAHVDRFVIDPKGDGRWIEVAARGLRILSDRPRHVFARCRTHVSPGVRFPMTVELPDRYGNPVSAFSGVIRVAGDGRTRALRVRTRGELHVTVPVRIARPGVYRMQVSAVPDGSVARLRTVSNPVVVAPEREPEQVYWGEIHVHSSVSHDGVFSPEFCCRYARDVARLDFFALTDHSESPETRLGSTAVGRESPDWPVPDVLQEQVRSAIRRHHAPGEFVTFFAYEYDGRRTGQVNVYHMDENEGFVCGRNCQESRPPDTPTKLCARLNGKDAVVIPHHPAYARDGMGFAWEHFVPEWMPVAEIYSSRHGSSEYAGCPRCLGPFDASRSIQAQLALGRRFGFTAGTDSHIGMAARRLNMAGGPHQRGPERVKYNSGGLTGVFARDLSRSAILEALRSRRCYAVSGDRVLLRFGLGPYPMGAVIPMRDAAPYSAARAFRVQIEAAQAVQRVELVCNNRVVDCVRTKRRSVTATLRDGRPLAEVLAPTPLAGRQVTTYCRVHLAHGEMAWSSPIWLAEKP